MAKKSNDFKIEDYVLVTELNRKFAVRVGRKMHVFSLFKGKWENNGNFVIRPRMDSEGWFYFGTHKCFVTKIESRQEYVDSFKEVIDHFIKEKKLYIKYSERIVKFEKP